MVSETRIRKSYESASERYAGIGVSTANVLAMLKQVAVSVHCWQGDDVGGFEKPGVALSGGGLAVTGSFPGKARNVGELREDLEKVLALVPGSHRVNLHSIYGEFGGGEVDRCDHQPGHFSGWLDWAGERGLKLDFNSTCFSHPMADSGFTLSHRDSGVRDYWIEHVKRCRYISSYIAKEQGSPCYHNIWIPDGSKDETMFRHLHRRLLAESLDEIFAVESSWDLVRDSLESKLYGIGSESYVVGSHEFYLGYALTRGKLVCLDMGHFHPTESVAEKLSALLQFFPELVLHISRGIRWDSDHVVIFNDELRMLMQEIVRSNAQNKVRLGLDFFDASINRVGAWVIGIRATLKALLIALLEPAELLHGHEKNERLFARLAKLEDQKSMPFGDVWNYYCLENGVLPDGHWVDEIHRYEKDVLMNRV